jgi:hypothetical protein
VRAIAIAFALLATSACGPTSAPIAPVPQPSAAHQVPAPPPPLESVATGVPVERTERWSPPARLVDQRHISLGRAARHLAGRTVRGNADHEGMLDVSFDSTGTKAAMLSGSAVSVWRRKPGEATWKQVLLEPWAIRWLGWCGDDLLLCGSDGITASFAGGQVVWKRVDRSACRLSGPSDSPRSGDVVSSDGQWTARVTAHEVCSGGMNRWCETGSHESVLRGPSGAALTVKSGPAVPALAPSGRFFAYQLRDTAVVIDTGTKRVRSLRALGATSALDSLRWLPDGSAVGLFFGDSVELYDPNTGALSSGWSATRAEEREIALDSATGEPRFVKRVAVPSPLVVKEDRGTLPMDAAQTVAVGGLARTAAMGKGTWALWDRDTGKALRVLHGALSFTVSPSARFLAVLRTACEEGIVCGAAVVLVDSTTGTVRGTLELPEATTGTAMTWFGPLEREILGVVERQAHFLRAADGAVLHAEPPSRDGESSVVLWIESGFVDCSDAELSAWAFRPAGRLDAVVEATGLRHAGLWREFIVGKPLLGPAALR